MSPKSANNSPKNLVKPRLIVVSAPSGAGKTTLCGMLLKDFPQIVLSISTTTRLRRPHEEEGIHYHFVSPDEFQSHIDQGDFAEWAEVHGNRYGTSKSVIEKSLASNKHVLFDIDVQGAMSLLNQYEQRALLIFIHPPSIETLEKRLVARQGDSRRAIDTRLQNAKNELEWSQRFDYQIVNDDLAKAYAQLKEIVLRECR